MHLKILIFPFFSLLTFILIVGFMKPDFDLIFEKKNALTSQNKDVESASVLVSHITNLNNSLDSNQDIETTLFEYLPRTVDHDSLIDAFNFLALDSGLVVSGIALDQSLVRNIADTPLQSPSEETTKKEAETFTFNGSVVGSYESIKLFIDRLTHIDRFQKIQSISLEANTSAESTNLGQLKGLVTIQYGYLKDSRVDSALNVPFLNKDQASFDISSIDRIKDQSTNIPSLVHIESGRTNPFMDRE